MGRITAIAITAFILISFCVVGSHAVLLNQNHINVKRMVTYEQKMGPSYIVYCNSAGEAKCDVYLTNSIDSREKYLGLFALIEGAPKGTNINLHLAGNGGSVDTAMALFNAIQQSKADVNTIVEGPVFSAHALISLFGKHITIQDASFFMFHVPAVFDAKTAEYIKFTSDVCRDGRGKKDRGRDMEQKCIDGVEYENALYKVIATATIDKYLEADEIKRMNDGYDVYITSDQMKKRVPK